MNAIMEQYLRCYVNYPQDDWTQWLPLAVFAANNHKSETTGASPFFANYGYHPTFTFNLALDTAENLQSQLGTKAVADTMAEVTGHVQAEMTRAQLIQQGYADKKRTPTPNFAVGDKVFLDAGNLTTQCPSKKIDNKRVGPCAISE